MLRENGVDAVGYATLAQAYEAAKKAAGDDGMPLICLGSLYTYSELIGLAEKI